MTREEVIDGLKSVRTIHNGNYAPQIDETIKLLEQTRWIHISERLPKIAEEVLVTYSFNSSNGEIRYVEIAERYGNESNVYWISRTDEYKLDPSKHKVVAWMPLPNSYKEDE